MYERVLAEISKAVVAWHGQECMAGRLYDKCCLHSMGGGESAKQSELQWKSVGTYIPDTCEFWYTTTLLRPVKSTQPPAVANTSSDNRLLLFDLWHTSVCSCSAEEAEVCADARWASYLISNLSFPGLVLVQSFPKLPKSAAQSSLFVQTSTLRLLDIVSR